MTTLYRPVLIESAEQAEALPIGTVIVHHDSQGAQDQSGIRVRGGVEFSGAIDVFPIDEALGDTALVPFVVTVEQLRETGVGGRAKTLYVTPWQEPASPADEAPALADCGEQA